LLELGQAKKAMGLREDAAPCQRTTRQNVDRKSHRF
jgi:hypothetical protein